MKMRKMLLLVAMAAVATAFGAAPAAQATAPEWYVHNEKGEDVKLKEPFVFDVTGEVAAIGAGFVSGPCEITLVGEVENGLGMALGEITVGEVQSNCPTGKLGCTVTPTIHASAEGPWDLTGATVEGKPGLEIIGVLITNHYTGATCGIPSTNVVSGTALAQLNGSACLSFQNVKDKLLTDNMIATDLTGEVCLEAPLTLK